MNANYPFYTTPALVNFKVKLLSRKGKKSSKSFCFVTQRFFKYYSESNFQISWILNGKSFTQNWLWIINSFNELRIEGFVIHQNFEKKLFIKVRIRRWVLYLNFSMYLPILLQKIGWRVFQLLNGFETSSMLYNQINNGMHNWRSKLFKLFIPHVL